MLFPVWPFAVVHVAALAALLIAGHVLLVLPARDRPHCLVPARLTLIGLAGGYAVEGLVWVVSWGTVGWPVVPGVGLVLGGVGGFAVGQAARAVLVRDD